MYGFCSNTVLAAEKCMYHLNVISLNKSASKTRKHRPYAHHRAAA